MLYDIKDDGSFQYKCTNQDCETEDLYAHASHEQTQWQDDGDLIGLPPCPDCGSHTMVKTQWRKRELLPPVITRGIDPYTGQEAILSVQVQGAPNLTWIESHTEKRIINGQPVDVLVIDNVYQHPAIARHQALAGHMETQGKTRPAQT